MFCSVLFFSAKFSFVIGGGAKYKLYKIITAADKEIAAMTFRSIHYFLAFISFLTGSKPSPPPKNFMG